MSKITIWRGIMYLEGVYRQTSLIEKTLDASWMRNEAISNNIANVDTPNYKAKRVEFEKMLNQVLEKNNATHSDIEQVKPKVVEENTNLQMRLDGNNVDIDAEMAQLAKNQILYNAMLQQVTKEFNRIKMVLK